MRDHFLDRRVPAGMMGMVVAVALVMSLLCFAMILAAYYYQVGFGRYYVQDRLQRNAGSGMQYLLAGKMAKGRPLVMDLYGAQEDSVRLQGGPWGVFEWGSSTAFHQKQSFRQEALLGVLPSAENEYALYLCDERRPLSIAGITRIEGKVFLPKSGIRSAYVGRVGYSGGQLVYGEQAVSQSGLPKAEQQVIDGVRQLLKGEFKQFSTEYLQAVQDTIWRSFEGPTLVYADSSAVRLRQQVKGKVIIYSRECVTVYREAQLEDVLLVAPKVIIEAGFSGSLQAIASDTLLVGADTHLSYPSALVLWADQQEALLETGEGSQVEGVVVIGGQGSYKKKLVRLGKESVLTGGLYADSFADLKGAVKGSVACRKFLLQTPATLYENHLFHATLSWEELPEAFAGSPLWWNQEKKVIAKWVD